MGKIDDMRRQREQQFADAEQRQAKATKATKAQPVEIVAPPQPARRATPAPALAAAG